MCWGVFSGVAFSMHWRTSEVYNFLWWIAGAASLILIWERGMGNLELLLPWGVFCGIQLLLFSRMYGKADCYAFCVCALYGSGKGWGFYEALVHMFLAFSMLAVVQLVRRNVNTAGNLKYPVPFLPYITASYIVALNVF